MNNLKLYKRCTCGKSADVREMVSVTKNGKRQYLCLTCYNRDKKASDSQIKHTGRFDD